MAALVMMAACHVKAQNNGLPLITIKAETELNATKKVTQVYRLNMQLFPLSWKVPEETDD